MYNNGQTIEELEGFLANREYWDHISGEWQMCSSIEKKLDKLGEFAHKGGDLNHVIALYAEGRAYTYRITIQQCIEKYIEAMTDKRIPDIMLRVYKLEKEEAVKLLTGLLKAGTSVHFEKNKYSPQGYPVWKLDNKNLDSENIFAAIEEEHRQTHPDETKEEIRERVLHWIRESWW